MAQSFTPSVGTQSHLHSVQEIVWMTRKTTGGTFWDLHWPECLSCVCNLPYLSMPGRIRNSGMRWSSASCWNVMHWIWVCRNLQFCCNVPQASPSMSGRSTPATIAPLHLPRRLQQLLAMIRSATDVMTFNEEMRCHQAGQVGHVGQVGHDNIQKAALLQILGFCEADTLHRQSIGKYQPRGLSFVWTFSTAALGLVPFCQFVATDANALNIMTVKWYVKRFFWRFAECAWIWHALKCAECSFSILFPHGYLRPKLSWQRRSSDWQLQCRLYVGIHEIHQDEIGMCWDIDFEVFLGILCFIDEIPFTSLYWNVDLLAQHNVSHRNSW